MNLLPIRRRSSPRVDTVQVGEKLRDVKRPACFSVADRRVSKLRHDCQTARSQACSVGRGDRRTPTDQVRTRRRRRSVPESNGRSDQTPTVRLVSSGRSDQPRPSDECPATAIRSDQLPSDRQTGVQREKGLSLQPPDWCPAGEGLITPTAGRGPRTKGLSLRPSARAACEGLNHSASAASLLGDLFGASRA